ncbi:MAG: DUF4214 domain-containing protein [Pseudomonadota bacterium]
MAANSCGRSRPLIAVLATLLFMLAPCVSAVEATVEDVRAIARLYSAAFDREPKIDGLNFWVNTFENGSSLTQIAGRFNEAPEFSDRYGPLDDRGFVEQLFRNVLGRAGAETGIEFWVDSLQGGVSRARVLEQFASSPENITKTTETFADMRFEDGLWTFESLFTNNLIAESLEIDSGFPRIGYPLEFTVTIDAEEATQDVTIALFAIDKDRDNVRQLVLDTSTLDLVIAGRSSYPFEVEVPASLEIPGEYFIGALIDAADVIGETSETDNETATVVALAPAEAPNLIVETLEPDRSAILLDRESYDYDEQAEQGVVNSDAGGTVSWSINGAFVPVEVEAFASMRLTRSDNGTSREVPLYLWNSEEVRYMNAYAVDPETGADTEVEWLPIGPVGQLSTKGDEGDDVPLSEFDARFAHLDFYFPGGLARELETALRNPGGAGFLSDFPTEPPPDLSAAEIAALQSYLSGATQQTLSSELCVDIRPLNPAIEEEETEDNRACAPLALVLPPPGGGTSDEPILFENGFDSFWGGDFFGFGVDFSSSISADNRGIIMDGLGAIPVTAFGIDIEFFAVEGRAQVLPISEKDNPPPGQEPGFFLDVRHLGQSLAFVTVPDGAVGPLQIFFSKDVVPARERIVTVGPVPVKLKASLTGNLGTEYRIIFGPEAANGVNLEMAPFVNIRAGASAAVTVLVADVGVEGSLILLQEQFKIRGGASINVIDDLSQIVFVPRLQLINEITGAKGALSVFVAVKIPTVEKCSWGIIPGFCPGFATVKYPFTLAQYTAYQKTDTLLDVSRPLSVITLPDGTPEYSQ